MNIKQPLDSSSISQGDRAAFVVVLAQYFAPFRRANTEDETRSLSFYCVNLDSGSQRWLDWGSTSATKAGDGAQASGDMLQGRTMERRAFWGTNKDIFDYFEIHD